MEEIVRAFNWVIDKGWVRSVNHLSFVDFSLMLNRYFTGLHPSGQLKR